MKKEELVSIVGISNDLTNGGFKIRWSNNLKQRTKQLTRLGCDVIALIELDGEYTKLESVEILKDHAEFQSPDYQQVIADYLSKEVKVSKPKADKAESKANSSGLSKLDEEALAQAIASLEAHLEEA